MTSERPNTIQRNGSRLYIHPITREKVPGVTSVLGCLPKSFLSFWAAKVTSEFVADNIATIFPLVMSDRTAAIELMKNAPRRNTAAAGEMGTEVHELYERLAKGQKAGRLHPELEVYAKHFDSFVRTYRPEFLHVERTVWSETHAYAGSFDFIAKIDGETVIGDFKTTRSGVHEEVSLQLAAYAHADYILGDGPDNLELPKIDSGCVLHVRPEAAQVVPVRIDDEMFAVFKLLLGVFKWEKEQKRGALGRAQILQ